MEEWKDIGNGYQVSNLGRVYNKTYERFLKPSIQNSGYLMLSLGRERPNQLVHRLVANAFIPNPDNLPEVNHKDEVKINNFAFNLEWCTAEYNMDYSHGKKFKVINPDGLLIEGRNVCAFARKYGLHPTNLSKVINGLRGSHKGWRRA